MIVITVARKPLKGAVVDNIVQWGTGGLNLDASRVRGPLGPGVWGTSNATVRDDRMFNSSPEMREWKSQPHDAGRFPTNVILEHKPGCQSTGSQKMKPKEGYRPNPVNVQSDGAIQFSQKPPGYQKISYTDDNGLETMETWECVDGCPVRYLNETVGITKTGTMKKWFDPGEKGRVYGTPQGRYKQSVGNEGYVSRFFKQFRVKK